MHHDRRDSSDDAGMAPHDDWVQRWRGLALALITQVAVFALKLVATSPPV